MTPSDIEQCEAQRRQAMLDADADALSGLLADDATWVHASANIDDKASFLGGFRTRHLQCFRLDHSQVTTSIHGSTAVVTGIVDMEVAVGGSRKAQRAVFTAVWVDVGAGARLTRWHSTRVNTDNA